MYIEDNGEELNKSQIEKIKKHYESKKILLANEVVKSWEDEDYPNNLDLYDKINDLIKFIKKINNL